MLAVAIIVILAGGAALLGAGYLIGVRTGREVRDTLRADVRTTSSEAERARTALAEERNRQDPLRADLHRVLGPLVERERLLGEMSRLDSQVGQRRDLTALLDQIAERGNLTAAVLHDDDGWPLAASAGTEDLDRLAATASLNMLLVDRLTRDDEPAPLSVLVHDAGNHVTLTRVFKVHGQRLSLTAVAPGTTITPTTLDPALASITTALTGTNGD